MCIRDRYHGGQALYAAIDKTKAARALSVIHEHLESAAASLEHSAEDVYKRQGGANTTAYGGPGNPGNQ